MTDEQDETATGPPLTDEQIGDPGLPTFGQADVQHHLLGLKNHIDRGRGGLTERDRELLLDHETELGEQSVRQARMEIRERVLNTYFDVQHLPYISETDRELIFEKAAEDHERNLRNALKEFVKFTHRGFAEYGVDSVDVLQKAVQEAEEEMAVAQGELFEGSVGFEMDRKRITDISEIRARFENREQLYQRELAVLVNDPETDVDLTEALYYLARQLWGRAEIEWGGQRDHNYSWRDPDAERAEDLVDELDDVLDELGIETFQDLHNDWYRVIEPHEPAEHRLHEIIRELDTVAPHFDQQLAREAGIAEDDMENLHRILWNPEKDPVEEIVEEMAKPEMAGVNWSPAESEVLQKFIARVQLAREQNSMFTSGGEEGSARWNRVLELAEWKRDEWAEYMQEQRVERCRRLLQAEIAAESDLSIDDLRDVESRDELERVLYEKAGRDDLYWMVTDGDGPAIQDALDVILADEQG